MISNRTYKVVGLDEADTVTKTYSLKELLNDDGLELTYALQEDLDSILDMKEGQSKYIRVTRDGENLGVIKRLM